MQRNALELPHMRYVVLLVLWLIATTLNIGKAFHIDDTFHLEAAQWIEQNPLRPMSGIVNWDNNSIPIYAYNQPPLYFYMLAAVGSTFGYSEVPLHIFQSFFTLLAIIAFFKIAELSFPKQALVLTSLLAFNPAFLVNQNLMIDVPLLSIHLSFIYILITPGIKLPVARYTIAALLLSAALLIKYTSLPLIVVLLLAPLLRKEQQYIFICFIPLVVLGLWSLFNYLEYGSIHLHSRPIKIWSFYMVGTQLVAFILCLGSIAPFTLAFFPGISCKFRKALRLIAVSAVLLFLGVVLLWYIDVVSDRMARRLLWGGFVVNGLVALALVVKHQLSNNLKLRPKNNNATLIVILLWGAGLGTFLILFAPFMATRHVLLLIPPLLLLLADLLHRVRFNFQILAVAASLALGFISSISDWVAADFYRKKAKDIMVTLPKGSTVWSVGHWGWQWYSKAAGMVEYSTGIADVAVNDYIVIPHKIAQQELDPNLVLEEVMTIVPQRNMFTYFSTTGDFASFYYSDHFLLPWSLTKAPVDTISIFRVKSRQPTEAGI